MDFATLIAPLQPSDFFETYWGRAPVHIAAHDRARFAGLFSSGDIDRLLTDYGRCHSLGIRLSKYENERSDIIDLAGADAAVDADRVFGAYSTGYTVNLNDLTERHEPIRRLAVSLSEVFGSMVRVNAFLTPAGSQGFPLHFDTHDVLIVQMEGAKSWRVRAPLFPFPTKSHQPPHILPREVCGREIARVQIEAGDVLYVPRGFGHEASTDDRPSLHLTVGVHTFNYMELVEESLRVLGWDLPSLRQSLPPGALCAGEPAMAMREELTALRTLIAERLPLEEGLRLLAARELVFRPATTAGRFAAIDPVSIKAVQMTSRVRRRPGTPCRVVEGSGWFSIQYPSHTVNASPRLASTLEYIAQSEEFMISELPGPATDEEKLSLVRRLIAEGLLAPAAEQP